VPSATELNGEPGVPVQQKALVGRPMGPHVALLLKSPRAVDPRPLPTDAGVGLLELVIIAAIVSVLAAIAVPSVSAARDGYELVTAGADVAAKFAEARTVALKRNRQAWVFVDPGAGTLQIQVAGALGPVDVGMLKFLPGRVAVIAPAATQPLTFDTIGRPVDGAGVLTPHVVQLRHTGYNQMRTITVGTT
jgi:Tfp pilus assembly protein FimT